MIRRIFISSVQRKLAEERKAIVDAVFKSPPTCEFILNEQGIDWKYISLRMSISLSTAGRKLAA